MENVILECDGVQVAVDSKDQGHIGELNELHLAMIGGGCAEVCPY